MCVTADIKYRRFEPFLRQQRPGLLSSRQARTLALQTVDVPEDRALRSRSHFPVLSNAFLKRKAVLIGQQAQKFAYRGPVQDLNVFFAASDDISNQAQI